MKARNPLCALPFHPAGKEELRQRVWERIEKEGVGRFPGTRGHIPNFAGAEKAAARLEELDAWREATTGAEPSREGSTGTSSTKRCSKRYPFSPSYRASGRGVNSGLWTLRGLDHRPDSFVAVAIVVAVVSLAVQLSPAREAARADARTLLREE